MDKVMNADIEKILEKYADFNIGFADRISEAIQKYPHIVDKLRQQREEKLSQATSSLTSLIIKWLENADICDECKRKLLTNLI
jgi:hypothetical protein